MTHKTNCISDIINITAEIGDDNANKYEKTGQTKNAVVALDAYKTCISAAKTQLIYKKLTGNPVKIDFLSK